MLIHSFFLYRNLSSWFIP